MPYPPTEESPQPAIVARNAVPKCMRVEPLFKARPKPPPDSYKELETEPKKKKRVHPDAPPVDGHVWKRNEIGNLVLEPDAEETEAAIEYQRKALDWLESVGHDVIQAWENNAECVEHPCSNPDCVYPEPVCPVPMPPGVKRFYNNLMAMPWKQAEYHCSTGKSAPEAFTVARKLVSGARAKEFKKEKAAERLALEKAWAKEKAKNRNNGESEVGPNGETEATHIRVVEFQKCGGKGQTIKVVLWILKEKDDVEEPKSKKAKIRWPLDPNQRFFGNLPIVME
jgi:hypothetical protein